MAFARPTLTSLIEASSADLRARFPGAASGLRRTVLGVIARIVAGVAYGLYGFIGWVYGQLFPDTADVENLRRHASFWRIEPKAATAAGGLVELIGTNGSPIPAGRLLQRGDGVEYLTTEASEIAAGVTTVAVEAVTPGAAGLASVGVELTFASPVPGVSSTATVGADGLTGGTDAETPAALLSRVRQRMGTVPAAGNDADYERWAREVPGVTAVWVKPSWMGAGTVGVTFICGGREDIFPTTDDLAAVHAYIAVRKPVTATVIEFAPTPVPLALSINSTPDTTPVREAIEAELADFMLRDVEPGGTTEINALRAALFAVSPASVLTSPAADVPHAAHEIGTLGTVTWS